MFLCILIPFLGTVLGSFLIFFVKSNINKCFENIIYGFSAGIMIAASVWSLIIPSINSSNVLIASVGLLIGILLFVFFDYFLDSNKFMVFKNKIMLAITLHNIPEGMAVGIIICSYLLGKTNYNICLALAVGVALQNIPEGLIVSLTALKKHSRIKSLWLGIISALFELFGCLITLLFTEVISTMLPFFLVFAAGTMIYVSIVELIPESASKDKLNIFGFAFGFILMMILDVVLG